MKKSKTHVVLLTGATGLLGRALVRLKPKNIDLISTYFTPFPRSTIKDYSHLYKLNINSKKGVFDIFKRFKPDFVIHTAALSNVDECEKNKKAAYKINVTGTKNILEASLAYDSHLIFTSSNAVFDGKKSPYKESDPPNPINYYGKTKLISEEMIQKSGVSHTIVRLILMYGWNNAQERANPVTWLIAKLKDNEKIKMVNDTFTNPLLSTQAAQAIWKIVQLKKKGIFHIAGKTRVNRYELAIKTAKVFGLNHNLIESVDSSYFKGLARRMPDTTYNVLKMKKELGIKPLSIHEGLMIMKKEGSSSAL